MTWLALGTLLKRLDTFLCDVLGAMVNSALGGIGGGKRVEASGSGRIRASSWGGSGSSPDESGDSPA